MKILMLAPEPFFQERGTPLSVLGRLQVLSRLGHEVDLVTYHVGRDVSLPGLTIHRIPRLPGVRAVPVGPSLVKIPLDLLLAATALRLLRRHRYDLLHTHEEASFLGLPLARRFGLPHLYDMHSSLPEQLANFRYTTFRPVVALFRWLERRVIEGSAAVITVCPALSEHARALDPAVPLALVENVWEPPAAGPGGPGPDELRAEFRCQGAAVVLYAGTFEPYQGLDLLLDAAPAVVGRRPDVVFLVVGGTPDQVARYRQAVRARGLDAHFRVAGRQPRERIPALIGLADVLVSLRTTGLNSPAKVYEYLRSGKPIVATRVAAHTQVLEPGVACLVEPAGAALATGLLRVLEEPGLGQALGRAGAAFYRDRYADDTVLARTGEVVARAAAGRRPAGRGADEFQGPAARQYDRRKFGGAFGRYLEEREVAGVLALAGEAGTVLDVGCGTGKVSLPLLARGARVVSLDRSADMLELARARAAGAGVRMAAVRADGRHLCFGDEAFDCVLSSRVLMHQADWTGAVAEMCRVARRAVVLDFPPRASLTGLASLLGRGPRSFRVAEVAAELRRHGFRVVALRREWTLPVALHRWLDRPRLSAAAEAGCRRLGLDRVLGAPVLLKAVREAGGRPGGR